MPSIARHRPATSSRPFIAVLGATGAQGGGVVRALLQDPLHRYAVRALTRQPHAAKARALAAAGAKVVAADLDARPSLERTFASAHGLFAVTNFWEHLSPERELAQARHIAEAARAAGVAHVVWSTLEDTRFFVAAEDPCIPPLPGGCQMPHFDAKGRPTQSSPSWACRRPSSTPRSSGTT
jgi:nucleoside-diphosphate-sugar epimerase